MVTSASTKTEKKEDFINLVLWRDVALVVCFGNEKPYETFYLETNLFFTKNSITCNLKNLVCNFDNHFSNYVMLDFLMRFLFLILTKVHFALDLIPSNQIVIEGKGTYCFCYYYRNCGCYYVTSIKKHLYVILLVVSSGNLTYWNSLY